MKTLEILPLSKAAIRELIAGRAEQEDRKGGACRRRAPRWPFPGTAELWLPDENGVEQYELATCQNLSVEGIGLTFERPLPIGLEFDLAIHQPELSFHGKGTVRHCANSPKGFQLGIEFLFDDHNA